MSRARWTQRPVTARRVIWRGDTDPVGAGAVEGDVWRNSHGHSFIRRGNRWDAEYDDAIEIIEQRRRWWER